MSDNTEVAAEVVGKALFDFGLDIPRTLAEDIAEKLEARGLLSVPESVAVIARFGLKPTSNDLCRSSLVWILHAVTGGREGKPIGPAISEAIFGRPEDVEAPEEAL
jgi:hypothetical protein